MLRQKIQSDQIAALKEKNSEKLSLLRYILSQIKYKEIDKKAQLTDEEVVSVLGKIAKELNESIEAAKKGKRDDLVDQNQKQLEIVSPYLPKELSDEELKKEIDKVIEKNKDLSLKNPKALIGIAVKELKSKAEPSRIVKFLQSLQNK
ncbi:GatB/YqeY domain-containing protein [Candidatus Roizmanbacteria bacterium]|nr:GatB/YqeY domain-containing protein [Candidatus Roizmanbacteria bacterium]